MWTPKFQAYKSSETIGKSVSVCVCECTCVCKSVYRVYICVGGCEVFKGMCGGCMYGLTWSVYVHKCVRVYLECVCMCGWMWNVCECVWSVRCVQKYGGDECVGGCGMCTCVSVKGCMWSVEVGLCICECVSV